MSDFLRIFKTRREYCSALLELSRGQSDLILADDYGALLSLLGQKQRILDRMEEFSRSEASLWERWRTERDQLPPDRREQCELILAETESILGSLYRQEQSSTDDLSRRRDQTRLQLESLSQGVRAHTAYQDSFVSSRPHRLDVGQ